MSQPSPEFNQSRQYLELWQRARAWSDAPTPIMTPHQFLLAHGREYPELAGDLRRGPLKECYVNAFCLAQADPAMTYVEGVATPIIPVDHAWCVTADGKVVDPTWTGRTPCSDYFGVAISLEALYKIQIVTQSYGVFCCWWKWPKVLRILNKSVKQNDARKNITSGQRLGVAFPTT